MAVVTAFRPQFDLSSFVQGLMESRPSFTLPDVLECVEREVEQTESAASRDATVRFTQTRYVKSLRRLSQFLSSAAVPADLTPRERLAIVALRDRLNDIGEALAAAFDQVTLPSGVFGERFDMQHRLAS